MTRLDIALITVAACAIGDLAPDTNAQLVYQDQMTSGAGWGMNSNNADSIATFGYDYSADGIPEAPNSLGGDVATTGVKLEANLQTSTMSVFTLYPLGQNFTGSYQLRFDAWMNYDADERAGTSVGTTEFIGGGIGYDDLSADIGVGAQFLATGDGGSSSDWRAYSEGVFLDPAEMIAGDRNGSNAYYSDFLPGVPPPVAQGQSASGVAGSPGFQWVTFEVNTLNGKSTVFIEKPGGDRLHLVTINADGTKPYTSDGNMGLVYADYFSSVTPRPDLTFGLIDNVQVSAIPEPESALLVAGGLLGTILWRRRARG